MTRDNKGSVKEIDGQYFARVRWTDENTSKERDKKFPPVKNESKAWKLVHDFQRRLKTEGTKAVDASRKTFEDLAKVYEDNYLIEAQYSNGVKVAGYRSLKTPQGQLKTLSEFFKNKLLRAITYGDIRSYMMHRRQASKRRGGEGTVSQTTIHRELALLRRMLNVAATELHWIPRNPFRDGQSLIIPAAEKKRERILSRDEEARLLAACTDRREHLRAVIICLIDTGCRKAEVMKMRWRDVDFDGMKISIPIENTKALRAKEVPISDRMLAELQGLRDACPQGMGDYVFGGMKDVASAWKTACRIAGIPEDTRLHDLRHCFGSRVASKTGNALMVARLLGHATVQMSYRYIQANDETLSEARSIINEFHAETEVRLAEQVTEAVN